MTRRVIREIEVEIGELTADGLGLGRVRLPGSDTERNVQVRNALPGETVTARVLKRRRGIWYAEAVDVRHAAAERIVPLCGNFPRCGGCAMQHTEYSQQLRLKQANVLRLLDDAGVLPRSVGRAVAGPRAHYRHKARLGVRCLGSDVLVGFRESFSNRVMRMADCRTLIEPFSRALPILQETIGALSVRERVPQVELAAGDDRQVIIVRHLDPLTQADRAVLVAFARATDIDVFVQPAGYDSVQALVARAPDLHYTLPESGLCLKFLPTDFTQVNLALNRTLVRAAVTALDLFSGAKVADLFCGIGNFSLALARGGATVTGYEGAPGSIARARGNAAFNGVASQCEFHVADLYDASAQKLTEADYLLLDPPRTGAGPNLPHWLTAAQARRAVYVSCNPSTFAADARVFAAQGFELESVAVFDMFPHTAHVETLGVFQRT